MNKNAEYDNYSYSGYGILFGIRGTFLFPSSCFGKSVLIFCADMRSSADVDNKKRCLENGLTYSYDLTPDEYNQGLHYHQFMVHLGRCNGI